MSYIDGKHIVGDKVWVYDFHRLNGHEGHFHNIKPQLGLIIGVKGLDGLHQEIESKRISKVVIYKTKKGKPTEELSIKSYELYKVRLADSYEEAVEEYNKLVAKEADFYREKLEQVENYLIK